MIINIFLAILQHQLNSQIISSLQRTREKCIGKSIRAFLYKKKTSKNTKLMLKRNVKLLIDWSLNINDSPQIHNKYAFS